MRRISSMPASTGRPEHQKQRLWLPYMLEARCVQAQVRFSYQKKSCSFLPGQSSSFTILVILKCMKKSEKDGFYTALDVGCVWLERALASK